MPSHIITCTCEHEFQDERYGKGRRLANEVKKKSPGDPVSARCTVCSTVRAV